MRPEGPTLPAQSLDALFGPMPLAVLIAGPDLGVLYANPAASSPSPSASRPIWN